MNKKYPPSLLFELGSLQVFHFPSPADLTRGTLPTEVYWQDKVSKQSFGPFKSIHEAMKNYTWVIATQKAGPQSKENVVYVDFKAKKRK